MFVFLMSMALAKVVVFSWMFPVDDIQTRINLMLRRVWNADVVVNFDFCGGV